MVFKIDCGPVFCIFQLVPQKCADKAASVSKSFVNSRNFSCTNSSENRILLYVKDLQLWSKVFRGLNRSFFSIFFMFLDSFKYFSNKSRGRPSFVQVPFRSVPFLCFQSSEVRTWQGTGTWHSIA